MRIAVVGAGGLVGQHLVRQLSAVHDVTALAHRELDITDGVAVRRWVARQRPQLIANCAVISVDDCERDPARAAAVNVDGPRVLAEAASAFDAELLHFSTNYVFDGEPAERRPYTIDDSPRPLNVYGQTKLAGELAVRGGCERSFIVRTSWVFGAGKESFLGTAHRRLLAGERIRAIADMWASATFVADLVARSEEILARRCYGTYQVVNAGVCSYLDIARSAGAIVGLREPRLAELIEAVSVAAVRFPAPRPRFTPMRCVLSEQLGLGELRGWRDALAAYIAGDTAAA